MAKKPLSPLDLFLKRLGDRLEDFAQDLLEEVNFTTRQHLRILNPPGQQSQHPLNPSPKAKKRAQTGRKGKVRTTSRTEPTLYDVLGVSPNAIPEVISGTFRGLSRRYHPDNRETGDAEKYKRVTEAWATLKDTAKRREYDRRIGLR